MKELIIRTGIPRQSAIELKDILLEADIITQLNVAAGSRLVFFQFNELKR